MSTTLQNTTTPARPPEDERLPFGQTLLFGLQHILTMYGGVVAVPLIVGGAAGMSTQEVGLLVAAALFVSGAATMLQAWGIPFFGSRLPLVQGISFAAVSTMTAVVSAGGGIQAVFGSILIAGLFGLVIAPVFSRVIRFFPPVVTGTIITVVGISLLPVAIRWLMGNNAEDPDYGSVSFILMGGFTLVVTLICSRIRAISRMAVLIGIVVGSLVAIPFGLADFSGVLDGSIWALPEPMAFGLPTFQAGAIISMCIVMLVIMTETTADILAVGEIVGTKVDSRRVADGLRADMLASTLAPIFNTFPATAFAQNVGVIAMTGIKSRFVVVAGGGMLVILGLLPVLGRVVASVPYPVLGGVGVVLFGSVAASGIRTLTNIDWGKNTNQLIVATAIAMGVIPIAMPTFYDEFPEVVATVFDSGISAAAITAFTLNLLFHHVIPASSYKVDDRALAEEPPAGHGAGPAAGQRAAGQREKDQQDQGPAGEQA